MELDDLYQEIILDHSRKPRNYKPLSDGDVLVDEENPTCGDHIRLSVTVKDGVIEAVTFDGRGCAISTASSSLMTESVVGKTVGEARQLAGDCVAMLRGEKDPDPDRFGDLMALAGVKEFPLRVKCATLGWHALLNALNTLGV